MEEKVLSIIEGHNKAISYEEIAEKLSKEEADELGTVLASLEKNLKIRTTNKGKYEKFRDLNQKIGVLTVNPKGFGFVTVEGEDEDYHVSKENMKNAINGDVVVITVLNEMRREAAIKRISERNLDDLLVGEFCIKDGKNFVNLDDDKLKIIVEIDPAKTLNAVAGHKVIVKLSDNVKNTNYYQGEVVRIIGHKDDPGVDILSIAARYGIIDDFPDEVAKQLETVPSVVEESEFGSRRDLREEMIFTIDGDDTKDIDDAISIKKLDNGNYLLGVHIADVSYYVKEGTPLYEEAYNRGTSSYLADTVIPMLPHQLSNGICSLNPDVDRLAISCEMEIDSNGETINSEIFESVIKSKKQMTYKNVNKIIENDEVPEGYEEFVAVLKQMHELSKIVRKAMINKGYIDFDVDEPKIIVDDEGKAVSIEKRVRGEGEKLIENFMIAANEAVATTVFYMDLPFIYRVHGEPSEEKINSFMVFLNVLGYKVNANLKKLTPKCIQGILDQLRDKEEYPILSSLLLKGMQKAIYDTNNIGHFGLASKCYTHFTSPIRRFPDLNVHRLLRTYLFDKSVNNETINYFNNSLPDIAKQSSVRERAAVDCERDVTDMKMAEYMENHIGEEFDGIIDTVTNYGFYVILDNLVEGLVKIEDLPGDYYTYQENAFCLIGKRLQKRYMIGNKVRVVVDSIVKEKGLVNFKLAGKADKSGNKQS